MTAQDDAMRELLRGYRGSARDRLAERLCSFILRVVATDDYRRIVTDAVQRGMRDWRRFTKNPPFTQPLDDAPEVSQ